MDKFVCRTCLYVNDNITSFKIVDKVQTILEICVPELKPNIPKGTIICSQCYYFLKNIENFKRKCIENQRLLINHNLVSIPMPEEIKLAPYPQKKLSIDREATFDENEVVNLDNVKIPTGLSVSIVNDGNVRSVFKNNLKQSREQSLTRSPNKRTIPPMHTKKVKLSSKIQRPGIEEVVYVTDSDSEVECQAQNILLSSETIDEATIKDDDDVFEEKDSITIVKDEPLEDENPSFFNRQSENGLYNCKLCKKTYKTSKGLYEHTLQEHKELKFYHCSLCHFFTLWKSALARHRALFHNEQDSERDEILFLFCYHCEFKTKVKEELVKHLKVHFNSKDTTYRCSVCRRNFVRKWLYDTHIRAHEENQTSFCSYCNKGYTKKYLREHITSVHRIYSTF